MKKVAIITLTKNPNFGNFLQNFALQHILRSLDCEPETIINQTGSSLFPSVPENGFKHKVKKAINYKGCGVAEKRSQIFRACCEKYIKYSPVIYNAGKFSGLLDYDLYIAGSDQVWNPAFGFATDFELMRFAPRGKKLSYAASFGVSDLTGLTQEQQYDIAQMISTYPEISVREESGKRIVEQYSCVPAHVHVDPTMLLTGEMWKKYCVKPTFFVPQKYILVYMLGKITSEYRKRIDSLAKKHNAKVINALEGKCKFINPLEFIWMIQHAQCVCTDSFHASVFSILFHKQFYIFTRKDQHADQSSRFISLLSICGISEEAVTVSIEKDLIDWEAADSRIAVKRLESLNYLKNRIDGGITPSASIEILEKKNCCGCSACSNACIPSAITMRRDTEGFLYPHVELSKCINCGVCKQVCPIINEKNKKETVKSAYAGYIKDEGIRLKSSSGGLFTAIANYILCKDGVVFGAALDGKQHVHHVCIDSVNQLDALRGSKYVQSEIGGVYFDVKCYLEQGKLVLFTGTACQISGLMCFLKKKYDNLITVDVLCHGTPSPKLWERYLEDQQNLHHSIVQRASFRHKKYGWKAFAVELIFANSTAYVKKFAEDIFMRLFLGNICLRPSCYDCKFKSLERDSDITLGDAWGIDKVMPEMDDDKGTSVILIHSEKGQQLLDAIMDELVIKEGDVDQLLPPTADSRRSVKKHFHRENLFQKLDSGKRCVDLEYLVNPQITFLGKVKRKIKWVFQKCWSLVGRMRSWCSD